MRKHCNIIKGLVGIGAVLLVVLTALLANTNSALSADTEFVLWEEPQAVLSIKAPANELEITDTNKNTVFTLNGVVSLNLTQEEKRVNEEMTASEAVYGFAAWLTTRDGSVTLGAKHDAAVAADLVKKFCDTNNLAEPREDWTDRLTHPTD